MSKCSENAETTCKSYPNCDGCNAYGNKMLTDAEIEQALPFLAKYCKNEYNDIRVDEVLLGASDIINRQKAEIESLRKAILDADYSSITALKAKQNWHIENSEYIRKLNEENDKLKDMYYSMQSTLAKMSMGVEQAKAEAIKEFANEFEYEILHKEFWNDHPHASQVWLNGYEQCMRDIRVMLKDKLKEMEGNTE